MSCEIASPAKTTPTPSAQTRSVRKFSNPDGSVPRAAMVYSFAALLLNTVAENPVESFGR